VVVAAPTSSRSAELTPRALRAKEAADRLASKLERESFAGWDPYDALNSEALRRLARTPLLRRVAIQSLKRSPVNVRPLLGIRRIQHTKALALLASAYRRLGRDEMVVRLRDLLLARALPSGGWGYDFDVQTRWGYYRKGQANAVATAFAVHALLDSVEIEPNRKTTVAIDRALDFAVNELIVRCDGESYFAYFAGNTIPIHNANLLISSLFVRAHDGARSHAAEDAVRYTVGRQRHDGTWSYGEHRALEWVDGFHTAYVLERLAEWYSLKPEPSLQRAIEHGTDTYITRLIDRDGAPRATLEKRLPLDVHAATSAITALTRLRQFHPFARATSDAVLDWTLEHMVRRDGSFSFQRHGIWTNRTSYLRWNDAHALLALGSYLCAEEQA
jgi:hypothetical protein